VAGRLGELWLKGSSGGVGVGGVAGPSTALRFAQDDEFAGVPEKQIPFGNDRKKGKDNSNSKSKSKSNGKIFDAKGAKGAKFRKVESWVCEVM